MEFFKSVFVAFKTGGIVMWFILALSVWACAILFLKISNIIKWNKFIDKDFVKFKDLLLTNEEEAMDFIKQNYKEFLPMFSFLPNEEKNIYLEDLIYSHIEQLNIAINVAPTLGLLGTFTGLIKSFASVSKSGKASTVLLASGINQALYTSIFGLLVAVILSVFVAFITRKLDKIYVQLRFRFINDK